MTQPAAQTAVTTSPLRRLSDEPHRVFMPIKGLDEDESRQMAEGAVYLARRVMPKLSGDSARKLRAFSGIGYFGIYFADNYIWYQEQGIRAFTMHSLAGKVIPMWIDDPYGIEAMKNPKAKRRTTENGRHQVLIFRRAAQVGETKRVRAHRSDSKKGIAKGTWIDVNKAWPGAPGRIANRQGTMKTSAGGMVTTFGTTGKIGKGNSPLWWRHPGLQPRLFLNYSLTMTAIMFGHQPTTVYADK